MNSARRPLVTALSISTLVCAACNSTNPAATPPAEIAFVSDTAPSAYFASGTFDPFDVAWLGGQLHAMGEPPLYRATITAGTTILRFLWLRSFDPDVAIRVTQSPMRCSVTTTIIGMRQDTYSAPGSQGIQTWVSSGPGTILRRDSISIPVQKCAELHARVIAARLWSGPPVDSVVGIDGDDLVFEMADAHGHKIAKRWTPDEHRAPEFRALSYAFIALGKVNSASSIGHQ